MSPVGGWGGASVKRKRERERVREQEMATVGSSVL